MKLLLCLIVCLTCACTLEGWNDMPGAAITFDAAESDLPRWRTDAQVAVDEWNEALTQLSCEQPFVVGNHGHSIALVPYAEWTHGDDVAGIFVSDGLPDGTGYIHIRDGIGEPDHLATTLHELGHAIGLDHTDPADGMSVMTRPPSSRHLQPRDIAAAACLLGCGPCS